MCCSHNAQPAFLGRGHQLRDSSLATDLSGPRGPIGGGRAQVWARREAEAGREMGKTRGTEGGDRGK